MSKDSILNRRLGPYLLIKRLAVGGMAEIYLALKLGPSESIKLVVLKCILSHYNNERDFVELFYHEAALSLLLQHPNIVSTWDAELIDGRPTMVMEYLYGQSLERLLQRLSDRGQHLALEFAVDIAISVLDALEYLHELRSFEQQAMGVVHRDVSPQNIYLCYDGQCKILDFGIARWGLDFEDKQRGMLVGKYAYMSPEQCRGERVDRRSDCFALATVLYEMCTGRVLFARENDIKTLDAVNHAMIVAPHLINASIPESLSQIIMRALSREAAGRYQSAARFAADLRAFASEFGFQKGGYGLQRFLRSLFAKEKAIEDSFLRTAIERLIATHRPAQLFGLLTAFETERKVSTDFEIIEDFSGSEAEVDVSVSKIAMLRLTSASLPKPQLPSRLLMTEAEIEAPSAFETENESSSGAKTLVEAAPAEAEHPAAESEEAPEVKREIETLPAQAKPSKLWPFLAVFFFFLSLVLGLALLYIQYLS